MSCIGKRYASVVSSSSVQWMTSMNCFLMKSMRAIAVSSAVRGDARVYPQRRAGRAAGAAAAVRLV